ncbi:MAG: response regulator [Bacteriovoracaceae bacterium]|nr:response regulator [Bacteriovoracaceae bacterium]
MFVFKKRDELKIFDNVFEPVIVLDERGKLVYFNQNFRIFSQLSPRILKKAKFQEIVTSKKLEIQKILDNAFASTQILLTEEIELEFQSESRWSVLRGEQIEVLGEKLLIVYFNDVSVEKKLYGKYKESIEDLKNAYQQILQSDKLSTMGELTSSISHEITNPLTIAKGNLEMIEFCFKDKKVNFEEKRKMFQTGFRNVRDSIHRIQLIVQNMRDFLHSSEERKEYCRLESILKISMELVAGYYNSSGVRLNLKMETTEIVVLVNRIKIEQVIVNLLKNAFDAINGTSVKNGKVEIIVTTDYTRDMINIDVVDNGGGISDKDKDDIFDMFFTTKNIGDGTGLGLSICKRIMSAHSGTLILESSKKGETVFRIRIPVVEASSYSYNETFLKRISSSDGKKILVVDNEVEVLNVMNKFLQDSGYVFIGSTNGEEALRFLKNIQVDLIITDVEMPLMSGEEFASKVRSQRVNVPLYYLSSTKNVEIFNKNKDKLNIAGFLMKPFSQTQVLDIIKYSLGE